MDITSLAPTVKLYQLDAYQRSATATVQCVDGAEVVLDQTVFYAESGGQAADTGRLGPYQVVHVVKQGGRNYQLPNGESTLIGTVSVHRLGEPATLRPGDEVELEIDWDRRYRNMQMHSLAHFMFHAAGEYFDSTGQQRRTKGAYIEGDSARFDFLGSIPADDVAGIEQRVRELLDEAGPATTEHLADDVLVWHSGEIDIPCGGTHVKNAREIQGRISLRRRSKGSGLTRLYVTLDRDG